MSAFKRCSKVTTNSSLEMGKEKKEATSFKPRLYGKIRTSLTRKTALSNLKKSD